MSTLTLKSYRYLQGLRTLIAPNSIKKTEDTNTWWWQELSAYRLFKLFSIALYLDCGISNLLRGGLLALLGGEWCG